MIKIKNAYGELPEGMITPEMDNKIWKTADPITITFTVSGLPTDKIEGYADEVYEAISGEGFTDYAAELDQTDETSTPEVVDTQDSTKESKADASSAAKSDSSKAEDDDKDEDSNLPLILGICGGVVVLAVIVVVIVKKK